MSASKDGGAAFPDVNEHGMTLRDYFAAKALAAYIANSDSSDGCEPTCQWLANPGNDPIGLAVIAYRVADAMLKAREAK